MSDPRTVKVTEVEVKTGGGEGGKRSWTKYTLVDGNGDKVGTFDTKIGKFLQDHIGKQVDVTTEQAGKFTNLLTAVEHVDAPKTNGNGYYAPRDPESESHIVREAALHAATRLYAGAGPEMSEPAKQIVRLADVFSRWIYSGEIAAAGGPLSRTRPVAVATPDGDTSPDLAPQAARDHIKEYVGHLTDEAKAVLHEHGIQNIKDIDAKLTTEVANAVWAAQQNSIPT